MNILIVGNGAREELVKERVERSPRADNIMMVPGDADVDITNGDALVALAQEHQIDFALVFAREALLAGVVDTLEKAKIACFGPEKEATRVVDPTYVKEKLTRFDLPIASEAEAAGKRMTMVAATDGATIIPLGTCSETENGIVAPSPDNSEEIEEACMQQVLIPTCIALNSLFNIFKGFLVFDIALTEEGPKVIGYDCCMNEAQALTIIPLMAADLLTVMMAIRSEMLGNSTILWYDLCSVYEDGEVSTGKTIAEAIASAKK